MSARQEAARALVGALSERGWRLACAESCTGGLVASAITDVPGASAVLWGSVVAYSNECKTGLLGVPEEILAEYGAVSRQTARAMALGASARSSADLALGVTGIAGPGGGSAEKPVGSVWFAWYAKGGASTEEYRRFSGDRSAIREAAAEHALRVAADIARSADIDKGITQGYSRV